jgi:hypothetical protein
VTKNLPARLTRLAHGFAVILVREPAAATTCAAASTAITTASWSARPARLLGSRFVDFQIPPADILSLETRNRFGGLCVVGHFHESEAPGPARLPVRCYVHARDLTKWLEKSTQVAFRRLKTHIADKQIFHILLLSLNIARSHLGAYRSFDRIETTPNQAMNPARKTQPQLGPGGTMTRKTGTFTIARTQASLV